MGRIGAPHGIKGWVKLISFSDPPENILKFRHFYLAPKARPGGNPVTGAPEQIEIDESSTQGKDFIAHISGCDDREQARQYTGRELQVEKAALPALAADEFYWFQLEGLQVLNSREENLGTVHHLMETGANDVLVVRASDASIDDRERLIPWIREQVIMAVDLEAKIIRVDWGKDF